MNPHAPYLLTVSGTRIDLLGPRPEDVSLLDVAHALARICRYTGHVLAPHFSVARHSINVARALRDHGHSIGIQAQGLLHDAHEAYTGDVASPIKRALRALCREDQRDDGSPWAQFEALHASAVRRRFGLPEDLADAVHLADVAALLAEARDLLPADVGPEAGGWPAGVAHPVMVRAFSSGIDTLDFLAEAQRVGVV